MFLIGYCVKEFMCVDVEVYMQEIKKVAPRFERILEKWVGEREAPLVFEADQRKLNNLYKKLSRKYVYPDYNLLVDQIIRITPSYIIENPKKKRREERKDEIPPSPP
jgi:hypothetical protein